MSDKHAHSSEEAHPPATPVGPVRLAASYSDGGHEVDATPNKNLMVFLLVMVVLMVVSALGVYQLFVSRSDALLGDAAAAPTSQLVDQRAKDLATATSYGSVVVEGKQVAYRVPFSEAKRLVLETPARFAAAPAPAGWTHPDDVGK